MRFWQGDVGGIGRICRPDRRMRSITNLFENREVDPTPETVAAIGFSLRARGGGLSHALRDCAKPAG